MVLNTNILYVSFLFYLFLRKLIDRQLYLIITSPLVSPVFLAVITMRYKAIVDLFIYLFILHLECFGPMATQYLIFSSSVSV